jgi:hypothetical protein
MAATSHDLVSRSAALLRDTAKLHTAAGLGFVASRAVVDEAVTSLRGTFAVVDARNAHRDELDIRRPIIDALANAKSKPIALVVSLTDTGAHASVEAATPRAVLSFVRAVADRVPSVDLGDGIARALPDSINLVVLVDGVVEHEKLPRQLQRVDFWEFLP